MKKIAYYISDHGYGHASRSTALIKKIVNDIKDVEVTVNCSYPLQFTIDNLVDEKDVKFRRVRNDFGYYTDENFEIDKDKTKNLLKLGLNNIESYINSEEKFCEKKDIDLIISDITAKPFEVANKLDIPSVGISNFTWWEVYKDLFGEIEEVNKIKEMYEKADLGLILPMETDLNPFVENKKIGLISRTPTKNYTKVRNLLNHEMNKPLVYFSHGKSVNKNNGSNINIPDDLRSDMSLISFSDNELIDNPDYIIPPDENDAQKFIEAADIVASKFGYSTAAEAVRSKKPMILTSRDIVEDRDAIEKLQKMKIVKEISRDDFLSGHWLDQIEDVLSYQKNYKNIPNRFKRDGREEAVSIIKEFLE